jgi:hypothetical protein
MLKLFGSSSTQGEYRGIERLGRGNHQQFEVDCYKGETLTISALLLWTSSA